MMTWKRQRRITVCVTRWVFAQPDGDLRNLTMTSCRSFPDEFEKGKHNEASPGFEHGHSLVMISDDIYSATQDTNLHIITSSEHNDQDLKDASNINFFFV